MIIVAKENKSENMLEFLRVISSKTDSPAVTRDRWTVSGLDTNEFARLIDGNVTGDKTETKEAGTDPNEPMEHVKI
jgi:hypothetical protein